ncbi:MAG TPA: acetate--CoA ligase family protein [Steroidobacteraceae bacterium]|nr:acetate--CoA ligase family protein [Steroidobacteraceae bacterium]
MNASNIKRLLAPRSIALVGGAWADAVAAASRAIGYSGEIWRVHPKRPSTSETTYFRSIDELPGSPDATFVAAPNTEVPNIAQALVRRDAGGFVCFAAGFSETASDQGNQLTRDLVASAGNLPFFGPNCYGLINFFDGAALWPDQVIGERRERGVALICQSGTIALNLLFNDRSLPIGYVLTVGNQTRLAVEDMIELLADDERVTAFGLYVEGIKDAGRFAQAVEKARRVGKPIAIVKAGRTEAAARTARSHTGSLSGADVVFDAFCRQAGVARCDSLATLCETLKLLHTGGPLPGRKILIMGASGGDMAMTADAARDLDITFPNIPDESVTLLHHILTDRVHIANPFDFHTHIWFDRPALRAMFSVVQRAGFDAVGFMIDCPSAQKADPASYIAAIEEFIAAYPGARTRAAVICSLPESLDARTREMCLAAGVVPLQGQRQALEALDLAAAVGEAWSTGGGVALRTPASASGSSAAASSSAPASAVASASASWSASSLASASASAPPAASASISASAPARSLTEPEGKAALAAFGVRVPHSRVVKAHEAVAAAEAIGFPVVMKAASASLEHKSDVGGVAINIRTPAEAKAAADRLAQLSDTLLVEEMISDGVAEILIGMTVDPQFGQVLVLGAGGVLTELLRDTVSLLPPFTATAIESALKRLKVGKLLTGYRGRPPADIAALVETALACTRYAEANVDKLLEIDINPVIVRPAGRGAVAVDALIRIGGATRASHGQPARGAPPAARE